MNGLIIPPQILKSLELLVSSICVQSHSFGKCRKEKMKKTAVFCVKITAFFLYPDMFFINPILSHDMRYSM